jgi:hypothetical protein
MRRLPLLILVLILAPVVTYAFPFGGRAGTVLNCVYNSTIYTNLGPPRGGEYIWTTATKTYLFGPPSHAGQWILGLAGAPYYCIYKISPLTIYTGISISMMGSSGPGSPSAPPTRNPTLPGPAPSPGSPTPSPGSPTPSPTPTPTPTPTPPQGSTGKVLLSEIHHAVDAPHGTKPMGEWIEIYNDSSVAVNVGGWKIEDAFASDVLPAGITVAPGKFVVIAAASTTRTKWTISTDARFVSLENPIGDGLSNGGDRVLLKNTAGAIVDSVSWGTNTSAFTPSASIAPYGQSLSRVPLSRDTDKATDWASRPPSPDK